MRARICPASRALDGVRLDDRECSFHRLFSGPQTRLYLPEHLPHLRAHVGRALDHVHAGLGQRVHLLGRRALAAGDDRAGVAHAASRRRGLAGDEADHRLLELALDEGGGFLLGRAADLADHDDGFGVGVGREQRQRVDEARADQRVAADADAGRLAHALPRQLVDRLVGQRAALRDDADAAFLADVAGDDAGLRLARR